MSAYSRLYTSLRAVSLLKRSNADTRTFLGFVKAVEIETLLYIPAMNASLRLK